MYLFLELTGWWAIITWHLLKLQQLLLDERDQQGQ